MGFHQRNFGVDKEILGWIVDGLNFTMQLTPEKCRKIKKIIKKVSNLKYCPLQKFQKLAGNLQHASFGIPGGKGLFSPIHMAMKRTPANIKITESLRQTLADWIAFVHVLAIIPTNVRLLVPNFPHILHHTDACKLGAGGVITPGIQTIQPLVWNFEWPEDIKKSLLTDDNPDGSITINDLELAGMVLGWLVLEATGWDLTFKHVGLFCDNVSAVAWAHKGHTSKSTIAARLLRLLYVRQRVRQVSSLLPVHIAGEKNTMADVASRAFKSGKYFVANKNLPAYFNHNFPLIKGESWTEFTLPKRLSLRVISCLRGELCQLGSLIRIPKQDKNIGNIGKHTAHNVKQIPTWTTQTRLNSQFSSQDTQQESGQAFMDEETKLKFNQSLMHYRPSARPPNWLANKVPYTKRRENTFYPSKDA
jgi:hypothetical protein